MLGRLNPGAPPAGDRDRTGHGFKEIEDHAEQLNHDRNPKIGCKAETAAGSARDQNTTLRGRERCKNARSPAPASSDERLPWDVRKTGSAAIECAFVAAGLLRVAGFAQLNIWDIAGGAALVRATGSEVRTKTAQGWVTLERFEAKETKSGANSLRRWRQPVILGEREA